jgi:hypothetical protein
MCYCDKSDRDILEDIQAATIPSEALVRKRHHVSNGQVARRAGYRSQRDYLRDLVDSHSRTEVRSLSEHKRPDEEMGQPIVCGEILL